MQSYPAQVCQFAVYVSLYYIMHLFVLPHAFLLWPYLKCLMLKWLMPEISRNVFADTDTDKLPKTKTKTKTLWVCYVLLM